jgi:hypothetical protein
MTIGIERARALILARDFLRDLLDPKKTPKIPKKYRTEAYWILRHFPDDLYLEFLAEILIYEDTPTKPRRRAKEK